MPTTRTHSRPVGLAVWLMIAGAIGWVAAFVLVLERLHLLENPQASASCDFNLVVQCAANLSAPQGSVFGFPNPLIGVAAWIAPVVVGAAVLAGARFARWFWLLFWAGIAFAFAFVLWLISQSIFSLGTLCPWCMVTWSVTIPTFYAVTLHLLRSGVVPLPAKARAIAHTLLGWTPLLAVLSFVAIAVVAQFRLDWISFL